MFHCCKASLFIFHSFRVLFAQIETFKVNLNGQNFSDTLVAFVNIAFICVLLLEEEKANGACSNWLFESANS